MMKFIGDELGKVVQFLRSGVYENYIDSGNQPFFFVGHKLEIANTLLQQEKDSQKKYRKYPMIALRMDTKETVRGDMVDYSLNIVIATKSDRIMVTNQRVENVYKPVLYPLYENFMETLRLVGHFSWEGNMKWPPHDKIDRPYYGTYARGEDMTSANIFSDPLDAIEIQNLKLTLEILNNCK